MKRGLFLKVQTQSVLSTAVQKQVPPYCPRPHFCHFILFQWPGLEPTWYLFCWFGSCGGQPTNIHNCFPNTCPFDSTTHNHVGYYVRQTWPTATLNKRSRLHPKHFCPFDSTTQHINMSATMYFILGRQPLSTTKQTPLTLAPLPGHSTHIIMSATMFFILGQGVQPLSTKQTPLTLAPLPGQRTIHKHVGYY
jgi:hypothetical protein